MKSMFLQNAIAALFLVLIGINLNGDEGKPKMPEVLEVTKTTDKLEVRVSQIGYRDTLLFYTFKNQHAVLKLRIDNKDKSFPMSGIVYLFAENVKEEDIKKWLNNQHSDGLYPDVPVPTSTITIDEGTCKVTSQKLIDHTKQTFGEYDNYDLTFEVKDYTDKKSISLKGFTGSTKAHIKTK